MRKKTSFHACIGFSIILLFFFFSLLVNNTIPYFTMPTLGQALWAIGYAESIAAEPLGNLYAHSFGYPHPAAIAFGLSAALPMSWLIKLGIQPVDTYSFIFAFWFAVSFYGAYKLCRLNNVSLVSSCILSFSWLVMPVILQHSGYSMLSLGIALMPFYVLCSINLASATHSPVKSYFISSLLFLFATMISIFMDGYTFMMFAVAAAIIHLNGFLNSGEKVKFFLFKAPVFIASFACAYVCYTLFIGKSSYGGEPLEFFRGWGTDVLFFIIPSKHVSLIFDLLHLSVGRNYTQYFGDTSVWMTTFSLPLFILAGWAILKSRGKNKLLWGIVCIAIFSVYMSLGPSLKIHSVKPENYAQTATLSNTMMMPAELAIAPTGSGVISENVPGFDEMRASYRWIALAIFSLWFLIVIGIGNTSKDNTKRLVLLLLVLAYFPNLKSIVTMGIANQKSAYDINGTIVKDLIDAVSPNETVAFIPWNNDFFANYLAPSAGFRTFNIGGDKNLDIARQYWPSIMNSLQGDVDVNDVPYITQLVINKEVDKVIIPYVNMLWSPHYWLCPDKTLLPIKKQTRIDMRNDLKFYCPDEIKQNLMPVLDSLRSNPFLDVKDGYYFSTVSLDEEKYKEYISGQRGKTFPVAINSRNYFFLSMLKKGWYYLEDGHIWSKGSAQLSLPVDAKENCTQCHFTLSFNVLNATEDKPTVVSFSSVVGGKTWKTSVSITSTNPVKVNIPLDSAESIQNITIDVKGATSPAALGIAPDPRVLGISLQSIEISK